MRRFLLPSVVVFAVTALACVAPADDTSDDPEGRAYDALSCVEDQDCTARCEAFAEQATLAVSPPVFVRSRCELAAVVAGVAGDPAAARPAPSCLCMEGDDDRSAFLVSATGPDPCLLYGRDRQCLYPAASFSGCDIDEPDTSCEATCSEVQRRLEVDALERPSVRIRRAACADTGCRCVLDIGGTCYVDDWLDPYDCDMGDAAILEGFERELTDAQYP